MAQVGEDVDLKETSVEQSKWKNKTKTTMKVVKPKGAFLNYYISQCEVDGDDKMRMTAQARRELGAKWKQLPAEEKKPFIRQTAAQKEQYKNQMEELKRQRVDGDQRSKGLVSTRCSPLNLFKVFQQLKDKKKEAAVENVGFGPLLLLKGRTLRRELCQYLVENFDVATSSIKVDGQSIALTVENVEAILGLQNEGIKVSTVMEREDGLALSKKYNLPSHRKITFVNLEKEMMELEADSEDLKARVLLYIVGRFLCPATEGGPCQEYYSCLTEDGLSGKLNWAKHVHEKLLLGIKTFHAKKGKSSKSYLTGCLLLLEIRFYDHLCGVQTTKAATSTFVPRISAWGKDEVAKLFSHSKDFRVGLKLKSIDVTKQHYIKRLIKDEEEPDHVLQSIDVTKQHHIKRSIKDEEESDHIELQSIRDLRRSLESNVASMTENINRMSENMNYMTTTVMSYVSTLDTIKDSLNARLEKSVEVKAGGDISLENIVEKRVIFEVGRS